MTINERAKTFIEHRLIPKRLHELSTICYINGAIEQQKIVVDKACEVYRKELKEIIDTFNTLGKQLYNIEELGELIHLEGSVKDFHKAMNREEC